MFWLTLPTISSVRRKVLRFDYADYVPVTFRVRYTDDAAPEGNDEWYDLRVWHAIAGTGPDCDGYCGEKHVLRFQFGDRGGIGECSPHTSNQHWRDAVAFLFGQNCGYAAGKRDGRREEQQHWLDAFRTTAAKEAA